MSAQSRSSCALIQRWVRFNAVGAIGICVQLLAVYLLGAVLTLSSLYATALGVEVAVLHNFFWHQHFTWRDRRMVKQSVLRRLLGFNVTTGAMSLTGNLFVVSLLMRAFHAPLLAANLFAVAACSLVNFAVSDTMVFRATKSSMSDTSFQDRGPCFSPAGFHGTLCTGEFRYHESDRADSKRLDRSDERQR